MSPCHPPHAHPRLPWSRAELLVAFRLYCRTPFGKLHQHNPVIIDLARTLGRTPSAVGMKACNFASLDSAAACGESGRREECRADWRLPPCRAPFEAPDLPGAGFMAEKRDRRPA